MQILIFLVKALATVTAAVGYGTAVSSHIRSLRMGVITKKFDIIAISIFSLLFGMVAVGLWL